MTLRLIIFLLLNCYLIQAQGLPGGQYDRYEEQVIQNNQEPQAMLTVNYKHVANDKYSMNDLGLKIGIFATENLLIGANYFYLFDQSVIFNPIEDDNSVALRFDYYGLNIDYFLTNNKFLPISLGVNFGFGQTTFTNYSGAPATSDLTGDWVSLIEPEFAIYYYVIPRVVANFNVGYRFVSGVEYRNINNEDLSGFLGGLAVGVVLY